MQCPYPITWTSSSPIDVDSLYAVFDHMPNARTNPRLVKSTDVAVEVNVWVNTSGVVDLDVSVIVNVVSVVVIGVTSMGADATGSDTSTGVVTASKASAINVDAALKSGHQTLTPLSSFLSRAMEPPEGRRSTRANLFRWTVEARKI
ncbi:hypothetical protein GUJ93_ZPchr0011g27319 [Zizania palustris]|uniref:Uncharacterized protein n=1 Tax=Zizania palustris TaxID=103762 RepID=A0A8J5WJV0_ZIZPA|nr:hypothetical protein GUJ93_ZPchr0011g27319 [Zizania palustris]